MKTLKERLESALYYDDEKKHKAKIGDLIITHTIPRYKGIVINIKGPPYCVLNRDIKTRLKTIDYIIPDFYIQRVVTETYPLINGIVRTGIP